MWAHAYAIGQRVAESLAHASFSAFSLTITLIPAVIALPHGYAKLKHSAQCFRAFAPHQLERSRCAAALGKRTYPPLCILSYSRHWILHTEC